MAKIKEDVKLYYEKKYDEEKRLTKDPSHQTEFLITIEFLKKHLPKKGTILDAGGGTGPYALELAKMGYDIVLLDLSPKHIKTANHLIQKQKLTKKIQTKVGSFINLSEYKDNQFDAVLCLGAALSHVTKPKNIRSAMKELIRVAKKNSKIFISVIGRLGAARYRLRYEPSRLFLYNKTLKTGQNVHGKKIGFTHAHFFFGQELEKLFLENGLEILDRVGLEGLSTCLQEETNKLYENKKLWYAWLKILKKTANDPTAYGASLHFMIVGKKR